MALLRIRTRRDGFALAGLSVAVLVVTGCALDMTGAQDVATVGTHGANAPLDGGGTTPSLADLPQGPAAGVDDAGAPDADPPTTTDGGAPTTLDGGDPSTSCAAVAACPTKPRVLGAVAGDAPSPTVTGTGTGSEWVRVRVSETVLASEDLRAKITLTSPPGTNYDVYAYYDETDNSTTRTECIKSKEASTSGGSPESFTVGWKDMQPLGGHDDSTNVTLEVRWVSGPCGTGAPWTLAVQGDAR